MHKIEFIAIEKSGIRDGTHGYKVHVDGTQVIDRIYDLDMANAELDPVWAALGIDLEFDWD